ncbi:ABC transporter substrate-binding protein [Pseudomonas gingeri]|uniref:ABC transporter substrate-binding protein n=1 Tax=Pseudomonas gingeri TaxID=117681 RepID=UPI0015A139C8|nr:ABC transporter substrate-binding protein [Pseudomonas gingeri]NWA26528.1 ABC transporter substrate-binding protein [Pseudomonas gingeri]NWD70319.1 ABC transporter substrate-binding protein [Pseudomonas gingeri]
MSGCRLWVVLLCLLASGVVGNVVQASEETSSPGLIHLASEEWADYTGADGHGLAWDLMRLIFEPKGVKVLISTEPYVRAIGLVQRGEADAWVGAYRSDVTGALYPRWHFDVDHLYALGLASNPQPTLETLGIYRLAWMRGYRYQNYLPNVRHYNEIVRRDGILLMLSQSRADYYIDALSEVKGVQGRAAHPEMFRRSHLLDLPLYLGFADNARGRSLLALYDQRMEELVKSGELRAIFEHWKQPYPFDSLPTPVPPPVPTHQTY